MKHKPLTRLSLVYGILAFVVICTAAFSFIKTASQVKPQPVISLATNKTIILYLSKPYNQKQVSLVSATVLDNSHFKGFSVPQDAKKTFVLEEYVGKEVIHSQEFIFPDIGEKIGKDTTSVQVQLTSTQKSPYYAPRLFIQVPLHDGSHFRVRETATKEVTELNDAMIAVARTKPIPVKQNEGVSFYNPEEKSPVLGANSDNDGYLDLLLLSNGYTDFTEFSNNADAIAATFYATEPYKSLAAKIRVKKMNNTADLGCHYNQWKVYLCDPVKVAAVAGQTSYNHVLVVSKLLPTGPTIGGWTEWGVYAVVNARVGGTDPWADARRISVHELGHLIGWLSDEYEIQGGGLKWDHKYYLGPNCDPSPGCPKWNTVSGTSCIASCSFTDVYRSSYDSLMKGLDTGVYNTVSANAIRKEIVKYSTIVPTITLTPSPVPANAEIGGQIYCLDRATGAKRYPGIFNIKTFQNNTSWTLARSDVGGFWSATVRADLLKGSIQPEINEFYPAGATPDQFSKKSNGITCTDSNLESITVNSLTIPTAVIESAQCKRTVPLKSINFNLGYCNVPARVTDTPEPSPYIHVELKQNTGAPATIVPPGFISNACWGGLFLTGRISSDAVSSGTISGIDVPLTNDAGYGNYCGIMLHPPASNYVVLGVTPVPTGMIAAGTMSAPTNGGQQGSVYGWNKPGWNTGARNMTVVVTTLTPSPTITPVPTITGTPHTWSITLVPTCADGSISRATFTSQFMNSASGLGYQTGNVAPGQQTISIYANNPYQASIFVNLQGADQAGLQLIGTPPAGIYYDTTGTLGTPTAAWYTDGLPSGNYTINFLARSAECDNLSVTPTPAPAFVASRMFAFEAQVATLNLSPIADTFVDAGSPHKNYGSESRLKLDTKPTELAMLKFDLSSVRGRPIVSAKLHLFSVNATSGTVTIKSIADTSWTEGKLTYAMLPSLKSLKEVSEKRTPLNNWKVYDLTSMIAARNGAVTTLVLSVNSTDGTDFRSRNATTNKPYLEIVYR